MHGLNLYDNILRNYDPAICRFLSIDPLCEKYYSISPYVYCANNPIRYIDLRGDSISVAEEHQEQFTNDMQNTFGDKASSLSFNGSGKLVLNGKAKDFTKGMTKDQKEVFKGMNKLMKSKDDYSVSYQSSYTTKDGSQTIDVNRDDIGGAMFYAPDKAIVVSPNITGGNVTSLALSSFGQSVHIDMNTTTGLFHEFGEALAGKSLYRGSVVDYENSVRGILKMPARPYDRGHFHQVKLNP
jgi:hypothetical protein